MSDPQPAIAFVRGLRAVREFCADPVPEPVVDDLLEVARWTGSSHNDQPWEFVVVRQPGTLAALAALGTYAKHLAGAPLGVALVLPGADPITEAFDEGRLSERIMLAARAHGLGSCIAWFDEPAGSDEEAKALLGVPAERTLRTVLALGYPTAGAPRGERGVAQPRKPLPELVYRERYGQRSP